MLHGNLGNRPLRDEPEPEAKIPPCPDELSDVAKEEWTRVTALLDTCGLVSEIDRAALAAYCQVYARWLEAEQKIADLGLVVKFPNGYPIISPYLAVANTALKQMQAFLTEFGMTPAARTRINASPPQRKEENDPKARNAREMFGR